MHDPAVWDRFPDLLHQLAEQLPVLGTVDGQKVRSQDLHPVFVQDAVLMQLHDQVQPGLSSKGAQDRIRSFLVDDTLGKVQVDRFDIDTVGDRRIRHDRRRIGVDQDDLVAFLTQRLAGLASGIVEFRCLSDHDRSRSDYQDLVYICSLRHFYPSFLFMLLFSKLLFLSRKFV